MEARRYDEHSESRHTHLLSTSLVTSSALSDVKLETQSRRCFATSVVASPISTGNFGVNLLWRCVTASWSNGKYSLCTYSVNIAILAVSVAYLRTLAVRVSHLAKKIFSKIGRSVAVTNFTSSWFSLDTKPSRVQTETSGKNLPKNMFLGIVRVVNICLNKRHRVLK